MLTASRFVQIISLGKSRLFASMLLVALAVTGCGAPKKPFIESIMAPEPPVFMTNGAVALLSHPGSWTARLTVRSGSAVRPEVRTGQLFIKGDRIMFAQDKCDRAYIWDNAAHQGLILSDALQGYAPFKSDVYPALLSTKSETAGDASKSVNGYNGHEAEVSALMSDTTEATFKLWKANVLDGFPVRVTVPVAVSTNVVLESKIPTVLEITDVKKAEINDSLYLPPDGFTGYASSAAMTSEYMLRHSKTRDARPISGQQLEMPAGVRR